MILRNRLLSFCFMSANLKFQSYRTNKENRLEIWAEYALILNLIKVYQTPLGCTRLHRRQTDISKQILEHLIRLREPRNIDFSLTILRIC